LFVGRGLNVPVLALVNVPVLALVRLGFGPWLWASPQEFIAMWEFYLCYCEGGFIERAISDVHLVAERPLIQST
jgi:hypothetical protein